MDDITVPDTGLPIATTTIDQVQQAVDMIDPDTPRETLLAFEDRVTFFKQFIKELNTVLQKRLYEWIEVNGEIEVPEINKRYYNSVTKKKKSKDNEVTLDALFTAAEGDMGKVAKCIASDGLNQGECLTVLGEEVWNKCFRVEVVKDVKTGVTKRKTKKVDTTFLPKKGTQDEK